MKIKYLRPIIGFIPLLLSVNFIASAATVGDFRSKGTGNWSSAATWQSFNGTNWVDATAYPAQTLPAGSVLISDGHTVKLDLSPAAPISSVSIGAGTFLIDIGRYNYEALKTTFVNVNTGGQISFNGSNTALRILENGVILLTNET